ncbi:hypothetical protein [Curtobacterium flaccumfaciens]|uniref:hypothetical protein n=1 Tax=Curtobacterium flaccumfaciens TaxID=2035 RepID=UPI00387A0C43
MPIAPTLERYWSLFEDWCDALDQPKEPTTPDTLVRFLRAFPAGVPTNTLRVRAVRLHHKAVGAPLDLDALREAVGGFEVVVPSTTTLVRDGEGVANIHEALAQQPTVQKGKSVASALRGRRDAFLIVLFAHVGLNRRQIRDVTGGEIGVDPLTIRGVQVPRGDQSASCMACAVTRWLRVVMPAELGFRNDVRAVIDPRAYDPDIHDCDEGLEHDWRHATTLMPAIDKHGWVDAHRAVSTRSLSDIATRVQQHTGYREQRWVAAEQKPTRFDDMGQDEFSDEMDDFDRRVAQALARSAEVVADAQHTSDELYGLVNPKRG